MTNEILRLEGTTASRPRPAFDRNRALKVLGEAQSIVSATLDAAPMSKTVKLEPPLGLSAAVQTDDGESA